MSDLIGNRLRAPAGGPGGVAFDDVHLGFVGFGHARNLPRFMHRGVRRDGSGTGFPQSASAHRGALSAERQCRHHGAHDLAGVRRGARPADRHRQSRRRRRHHRHELGGESPPDGYTLVLGSSATITAGPAVYKHPPYDPFKELVAIGAIQLAPIVLTVAPKTPVSSFAEYVARAKARPGRVTIASAGSGSSNHLAIELLMRQAHLQLLDVPYKGSGPALTDLIGSQVESMMDQLTASIGHIREGRIRAIAITSRKRSPDLPDVPTLDELGVKGYEASTFTGLFAPAATPPPVLETPAAALRKAMANGTARERFRYRGWGV